MSDNILQTVQQVVQDVIAPDVRELKVRMTTVEKQIEQLQKHMDDRFQTLERNFDVRLNMQSEKTDAQFKAQSEKSDAQFQALMAAIKESRAEAELTNIRVIASLSERVAVLEAQRH